MLAEVLRVRYDIPMDAILLDWPYLGLGLGALLAGWLLFEKASLRPRWRDPAFVLGLLGPMYLVHPFEEHGIDALGRHYAFLPELCRTLGFSDVAACPADASFIFAVNAVGCWISFALALACRRRAPLVAACCWGIPLVNAATHLGAALATQAYNPGALTSALLFVPMGAWMLRVVLASGAVTKRQVPRIFATGAAVHVVLLASLLGREHGLPHAALLGINAANGFLPLAFGRTPAAQAVTRSAPTS